MRGREVRGIWEVYVKLKDPALLRLKIAQSRLTHRQLAQLAGLKHHSTISHLLNLRMTTCTQRLAEQLEFHLRCRPGELFEPRQTRRSEMSTVSQALGRAS